MGFTVDAGNTQRVPVAAGESVTVTTRRMAFITAQSGLGLTPGTNIGSVSQGTTTYGPYPAGYLTVLALGEAATVRNVPAPAGDSNALLGIVARPTINTPAVAGTSISGAFTAVGTPAPSTAVQWLLDGAAISGATAIPYASQSGDSGKSLQLRVTATNSSGTLVSTSDAVVVQSGTATNDYDLVIYGAGWPGVEAAIMAKRTNPSAKVLLIDWRNGVGGHTTGAIQFTDAHSATPGLWTLPYASPYRQMFTRLAAIYGRNLNTYFQSQSFVSESKTTQLVTNQMLAEVGIVPVMGDELLSVTKSGALLASATFSGIGTVTAKQWIECSYTGDLARMSGVDMILGREAIGAETNLAAGFVTSGDQPTNFVDPYITPGVSASGLIKYVIDGALPAQGTAVPDLVQFPGFRMSVTDVAGKKVPFPLPADVDPGGDYTKWGSYANFEAHRRDAAANKQSATAINNFLNIQAGFGPIASTTPGMTNKRDANNGGIFSLDFPDTALIVEFNKTANKARRLQIQEIMREYVKGYLYFLMNDPAVPAAVRTDVARYGFPNDDYLSTGGFPPEFYLRESWRVVGDNPVNGLMLRPANGIPNTGTTPVALGMYAFDTHPCGWRVSTNGGPHVIQEGQTPSSVIQSIVGARIDRRVLHPKESQCPNLQLGGTTPNSTQRFFTSGRIEGTMACMAGFAAVAAVKAIELNTPVQQVPYSVIAPIHNLYGLDTAGAVTLTADGSTRTQGTVSFEGTWTNNGSNLLGTNGQMVCTATSGTNAFTYFPAITEAGNYMVQLKYLDTSSVTRGTPTFQATAGGAAQTAKAINQNSSTAGVLTNGDWETLGTYAFTANDSANNKVVCTHDNTANQSNTCAIRLIKV